MKIAVVGSGIAGMGSAWLLSRAYEVHLFEQEHRLGGHTHTVVHSVSGQPIALDTGFLVYNEHTYPLLTRLFGELDVATRASDMSFSVSCRQPDLEYAVHSAGGLFAQPQRLLSPSFLRMLLDIVRFGSRGRDILANRPDPTATVDDFLRTEGFSEAFATFYLLPMTAAIWSSGRATAAAYPRDALLRFLANHGLLQIAGQPEWRTVVGGSHTYVRRMASDLGDRVHLGSGVERIARSRAEVELHLRDGRRATFDHVVVAAHADQALAMLERPTERERELLGQWTYSRNDTWLHTDIALLPRRRAAWASWNSLIPDAGRPQDRASLTYHLNRLQGLDEPEQYLVTLNPASEPARDRVLRRMTYHHPVYTRASVATQPELPSLNGRHRTWFCGAYFGNGFHEDGFASAVAVARDLGVAF